MKWERAWNDPLTAYLEPFDDLVGDRRPWIPLTETVRGIIRSGRLVGQRIAAHAPVRAAVTQGAQRSIRMVTGVSTKRSPQLDATPLTAPLRTQAVAQLRAPPGDERWLLGDGSDLRKPHAKAMPDVMKVRALGGGWVPGYRTLTVLGMPPGGRGLLQHRVFSSTEAGFVSEPHAGHQARATVRRALAERTPALPITWILDSGCDDVAVWRTLGEQDAHLRCRLCPDDRRIPYLAPQGGWAEGSSAAAGRAAPLVATTPTMREVRTTGQPRAKRQAVTVIIHACPLQLTYATHVRRTGSGTTVTRPVGLVEIRLADTALEPWLLRTDWAVATAAQAPRIFQLQRPRWGVQDSFKCTTDWWGGAAVHLRDRAGSRTVVAWAWVAAGFRYDLGMGRDNERVQVLARLGGREPRPDRRPGKITLTRGLRRLIDLLTTNAWLQGYDRDHGPFPPGLAAFRHGWRPDDAL